MFSDSAITIAFIIALLSIAVLSVNDVKDKVWWKFIAKSFRWTLVLSGLYILSAGVAFIDGWNLPVNDVKDESSLRYLFVFYVLKFWPYILILFGGLGVLAGLLNPYENKVGDR